MFHLSFNEPLHTALANLDPFSSRAAQREWMRVRAARGW